MISSQHYCLAVGIFALFLSGCSQFNSRKILEGREISRKTKPSVVLINYENRGGHGSGFLIPGKKSLCTVLTARHVIDDSGDLQLKTQDGNIWGNLEVKPFPSHDLALITFKPLDKKCPYQPLKLGDSDQVSEGDQVYISGYFESSGNLVKHFVRGNVTAISQLPEGYGIAYAATTGGGMSGGPVLNRFGEVIAIHGRSDTEIRQLAELRGESLPQLQQFEPEKFGSKINTFKWGIPTNLYLGNIPAEFETRLEDSNSTSRKPKIEETDKEPEAWFKKGNTLRELGKYNEALASYDKAIELNPNYADAWIGRGNSLKELAKYNEALASYDKAIELNPKYADAWIGRGNSLKELAKYNEALASYDKAIKLNPKYANAWIGRGNSLKELAKYNEALASYDKAIELNPKYADAWIGRGISLNNLEKYNEALASYDKAIKLNPKYANAWIGRGNSLNNLEKYNEALASYDKAIELNPQYADAWIGRGNSLNNLEKYNEALASYDKAIELNPNYADVWNNRGWSLENLKRYDEALESYQKAIEFDSSNKSSINNRKRLLEKLGR